MVGSRRVKRCAAAGLTAAIAAGILASFGAGVKPASATTIPLKAVVTLAPLAATVNQNVVASAAKSTLPAGDSLKSIVVNLGDATKSVTLATLGKKVAHHYVRPGHYTVVLSITDRAGKKATGSAVEVVTAPSGSYTGVDARYGIVDPITFYVSDARTQVQDILIPAVQLTCTPGGARVGDHLAISAAAISAGGAFAATVTEHGVYHEGSGNYPATYTYSFKGAFTGVSALGAVAATGTFSETLRYADTAARTCLSGVQSWASTRDAQPAQPTALPPVGSYTGADPDYGIVDPVSFYVSASRTQLQDILIPTVFLCVPGDAEPSDHLTIAVATISSVGAFSATATQQGVYRGYPATFTYTFQGHFHGVNAAGTPRAAGTFVETLAYTDTAARACTSDVQAWTATRDSQPAQTAAPPPAGSYTGADPDYGIVDPVNFYVSASRTQLQDILLIPVVYLTCAPGDATVADHLTIAAATVSSAGAFSATATQQGVYRGYPATFTYTFQGHFDGVNAAGTPRAAGSFSETLTYSDTTARNCTSNLQAWAATRDSQPAQTAGLPPAGSYTGADPDYGIVDPITFSVSGATLQDIAVPVVELTCAPGGATASEAFTITSATIASDGSFTATGTGSGVYAGQAASFTYSFRGNFEGVNSSGNARAAGTFLETMTYTNGPAYTCTSDEQAWTAALSGP